MRKALVVSVISAVCVLTVLSFAQYSFQGTSSITINQPHYAQVDTSGRLWMCEYGSPFSWPVSTSIRCLDSSMNNAIPPMDIRGSFFGSEPSGLGIASDGKVYIGNDGTTNNVNNVVLYTSDGVLDGAGYFTATYPTNHNITPGDIAFDGADHLFLVHKGENGFSVFNRATGAILSGCPVKGTDWGSGETGGAHINRGIAVSPDGMKVYIADTSGGGLDYFEGSITGSTASYSLITNGLWKTTIGNPAIVEIDSGGRLWVPVWNAGLSRVDLYIYDTYDNTFLASYTFSQPNTGDDVRIIGLGDNSQTLYLSDNFGLTECHIHKYTGTPPAAHITPTPTTTPTPYPPGWTAVHNWTMYE